MSFRYIGGLLGTAPTIVASVDGEGGTASGMWTKLNQSRFKGLGTWPARFLDKELWSWGNGGLGMLGIGGASNKSSPNQVGALTTWAQVDIGDSAFAGAVRADGTLWMWGQNTSGQLGLGNTTNYSSPKQVGALTTWLTLRTGQTFSAASKTDGTLWTWGDGSFGGGPSGDVTYCSSPVQIGALTTWSSGHPTAVGSARHATGLSCILAIKTDGSLWGWGANDQGQLGLGNTTSRSSPVQVGALTTWSKVVVSNHAMAVKTDGTLWTWGKNDQGQLGKGDYGVDTRRSSPVQVGALTTWLTVACGRYCSIAIKTDGTLWTWGHNSAGQLGLGNTTYFSSPKQVGALTTWLKISGGYANPLAIKTDGTLWAWGYNASGALGDGTTTNRSSPVQVGALTTWVSVNGVSTANFALKTP